MNMLDKIKFLVRQVRGLFPQRVPTGLTEFNTLISEVIELYNPPGNERSIRFVISSLLMRLGPTEVFKSKWYFASSLIRAAAAQVAVHVQEEIKKQQAEEYAQQQAEATAKAASNEQPVQN